MRILLTLLLGAGSVVPLLAWWERRAAWEEQGPAPAPPAAELETDPGWWRARLGDLPPAPAWSELRPQLVGRWQLGTAPDGSADLLVDGARGAAARLELARWLELGPGSADRIEGLEFRDDEDAVILRLRVLGTPASLAVWAAHLLEAPRDRGYLGDPARLRIEALDAETSGSPDGAGAATHRLSVDLRVVPAESFLGDRGEGKTDR